MVHLLVEKSFAFSLNRNLFVSKRHINTFVLKNETSVK